ncbi:MAG: type II toxin-antitoxin system RelE/ParE family toxin [SAR324 cluster bacterium]
MKNLEYVQRIQERLDRFELGNLGDFRPLKGRKGLFEARMFFGPGYRIYFALEQNRLVVLFCEGDKGTQRPDVRKAQELFDAYRSTRSCQPESGATTWSTGCVSTPRKFPDTLTPPWKRTKEPFRSRSRQS